MNFVRGLDIRAEGRIGEDDVETAFKNTINVDEPVMVMDAAVAIPMHDHVHFACAGHAIVGIRPVDTAIGKPPEARVALVLIQGAWISFELRTEHLSLLRVGELFLIQLNLESLDTARRHQRGFARERFQRNELRSHLNRWQDRKSRRPLSVHHANHEFDDGSRGEKLPNLAPERTAKELSKAIPLMSSLVSDRL